MKAPYPTAEEKTDEVVRLRERITVLERHRDVWRRANGMILAAVRRGQLEEAQSLLATHDAEVAACEVNPMACKWCGTNVDCPRRPKTGNENEDEEALPYEPIGVCHWCGQECEVPFCTLRCRELYLADARRTPQATTTKEDGR